MHPVLRFSSVLVPSLCALAAILYSAGINPHSATWLTGFLVTTALLAVAIRSAKKSPVHRAYAIYLSTLSLYLLAVWFLHVCVPGPDPEKTKERVAFWTRILCIGSVFMPVTLYHFTLRFAGAKWRPLYVIEVMGWITVSGYYFTNIIGTFIKDYIWSGVTWVPTMDGTYLSFFFVTSFFVTMGVVVPVVYLVKTHDRLRRLQLAYYLLGAIPLWLSCWGHFLISLGINIYPAGGVIFLVHASIMAYAVFQRRVFDFSLVLRRALAYATISVVLGMLYALIIGLALLAEHSFFVSERSRTIVFIIATAFLIAPLHSYCQRIIDQLFYREQRNQQRILQEFAEKTASTVNIQQVSQALCQCLEKAFKVKFVQLYLADEKGRLALFSTLQDEVQSIADWPNSALFAESPEPLPTPVTSHTKPAHREAVLLTEQDERMRVPLRQGEQCVGQLVVGPKRADERFTAEDLQFANIVANSAAVALENGRSYLQLRQIQELNTQILNGIPTSVLLIDGQGKIISGNESSKGLFSKVLTQGLAAFALADLHKPVEDAVAKVLRSGRGVSNVELFLDGPVRRTFLLGIRPLAHKNTVLYLLIAHDITDYKEVEERNQKLANLAQIGETVASINHEIKNVLQPIRFQVETLTELQIDDPHFKRCMEILPNRMTALDRLLNDLRDLARPLELRKLDIDFEAMAESVIRDVKALPGNDSISFRVEIHNDARTCHADGHWIRLVLLNIVRNAAEATRQVLEPHVRVVTEQNEQHFWVKIIDNGCGISESSMRNLFKPFYSTKGESGNGLGLAISRKVIELHGGHIKVESTPSSGTQFTVLIPRVVAAVECAAT